MEDKKTLKIASIIVAVLIAIFCITRILAAGITYEEDGEEWESTAWGYYAVTEDGEVIYSEEGYESKDGTYKSVQQLKSDVASRGIYYDELDSNGSIFCIEQGQQLPSRHDENEIRTMGSGSSKGDQYHNGSIVNGLNPNSTSGLNAKEVKALEKQNGGDTTKAIRGNYSYNHFSNGTYYSRSLKDTSGRLNPGKVTTFATENDGNITWSNGKIESIDSYEKISWEDAYVLANSDPNANTEKNSAQLALWKLGKLNKGKTMVDSTAGDELYEKALLFGTYRQTKEEREKETGKSGPQLVNAEKDYTYKFNIQGNYLIAGPIKIDYGDLTLTSDNAELEVRQIENFTVWGTLADSDELQDITEYVKFTDAEGNELENMNETVGTTEGEGAGKKFPKNNEEFYIKVDYNSPIYTEVIAINSLEASFKELDVRAVGYKLSDIPVYYTQWLSNNIMWQDCIERHSLGDSQTVGTHLKGDCSSKPRICYMHSDQYYTCYINIDHRDNKSESEGILLKGTTAKDGNAQMLFLLHKAELYWRRYKLVVLFGPDNDNPPSDMTPPPFTPTPTPSDSPSPDVTHRTYIDIGGNVWVDDVLSKEGDQDELDGVNGTGEDYPRPNVKVTLHFEDDSIVQKEDVAEWARDKFENPTYTDDDGNYMFYQLPMDKKYYVEFTYDGMMYTTTEFLAGGSVDGYKSNPNDKVYETNSKAEEQKDVRENFNGRFEEIFGVGSNSLQNGQTTGRSTKISPLNYRTEKFNDSNSAFLQSRLLTTDNKDDVINNHATGKAKEEFEISTRTSDKQLIYPFGEKEYTIWDVNNPNPTELEYLKHINLGLKRRPTADFRLAVDLKAGATTIKDKEKVVFYKPSAKLDDLKQDATNLEDEYIKQEISASDYNWNAKFTQIYGDDGQQVTGYVDDDQLNVYVLYKIVVANQCELDEQQGVITGIVDYFDDRLTTVPPEDASKVSKLFNVNGFEVPEGATSWVEGDNTKVTWDSSSSSTSGYNAIETKDLNLTLKNSGDTKAIYLILKVKNNGEVLYNGVEDQGYKQGIQNIAEIKSYKVLDEKGNPAGLVDCDSAPYNATPGNKDTYEDDTDNAPMFQLILNWEPRKISGNVWDDAVVADAIRNGETGVNNVKVELIEYCYNSETKEITEVTRPGLLITNYELSVDKNNIIRTGNKEDKNWEDGYYEFYVEGGNYAVKFIYGDTVMLNDPSTKQYNAQDYFAAQPYSALSNMEQYNKDWSRAFATKDALRYYLKGDQKLLVGDPKDGISATQRDPQTSNRMNPTSTAQAEFETKWEQNTSNDASNARDNSTIRADVIRNAVDITNKNATLLNKLNKDAELSPSEAIELSGADNTTQPNYTYMEAMSDIVIVASNDLVTTDKVINLGLQERPKASMNLKKEVTKIVIRTNDGTELINTDDASKLTNLQKLDGIQSVFMNMDTKSMEGATIDIDYKITVTNDSKDKNGEYKDDVLQNYVYVQEDEAIMDELATFLGKEYFKETITRNSLLPIRANSIYDYVNINLEYREDDNKDNDGDTLWKIIYDNNSNETGSLSNEMVISDVTERIRKENRVVSKVLETEDKANKNLTAGNNYEIPIHLGITLAEDIEGDNRTDDFNAFAYSNCAEIIQIYSGAGRRDEQIIPGNYVPYTDTEDGEPDSSLTGSSVITPPLGENRIYYVITIISATIIIAGIVLIKKKVLKK